MPEDKQPRLADEINLEFTRNAAKLGELVYKISELQNDANMLRERMRDINFEAIARYKLDSEKKAAEAPKVEVKNA